MNPIKALKTNTGQPSGSFTVNAMKTIRLLQKQWREIGELYQKELLHPTMSGPAHHELLRNLAQQMTSIKMQIDAIQDAVIQHEALAALKKETGDGKLKAWQALQDHRAQSPPGRDAAASSESRPVPKKTPEQGRSVTGTVGSVIDTKA